MAMNMQLVSAPVLDAPSRSSGKPMKESAKQMEDGAAPRVDSEPNSPG